MNIMRILILIILVSCKTSDTTFAQKNKNVILMIGDGMGPGQISLLYYFLKYSKNPEVMNTRNAFERLARLNGIAISETGPFGNIVVDSACSATQLSTGHVSRSEMIGLDKNGNSVETILEKAHRKGLLTGLVSDTRMTHATPAAFVAHVSNRWLENEIAEQYFISLPDVLLSGGANRFVPQGAEVKISEKFIIKSKRIDNKDLLKEAKEIGYQIVYTKTELKKIDSNKKVLGLFTNHSYPDATWFKENRNNPNREIPTLLEMSKAAITKLGNKDQGFFLMIEGGQIDWAGHRNDAGTLLHEMLSFNETLNWVIDWVEENPDTLLVVTADHETGGFGLGYNIHDLPVPQRLKGDVFVGKIFRPNFNYGKYQSLNLLYQQKKSLMNIWKEFEALTKSTQTAIKLKMLMEKYTGMKITLKDAEKVLVSEPNKFRVKWQRNLDRATLPKVHEYREYYYNERSTRTALMGQALVARQNVVWGTGGHTATGVHVYSFGPRNLTRKFSGNLTHSRIGVLLQEALGL